MASLDSNFAVPGIFSTLPATLPSSRATIVSTASSEDLIRDRSAADTLRFVLANSHSTMQLSHHDHRLIESFQAASTADKAFVTSVTDCSEKLQLWCQELERWVWSGNFEDSNMQDDPAAPNTNDPHSQHLGDDGQANSSQMPGATPHPRHHGGLSIQRLADYRDRLRAIRAELGNIDMAEMKDRALTTHLNANGLPSEPFVADLGQQSPNSRLDVLSALVTVALLEALPHYSQVQSLEHMWSARITVLERIPRFLTNIVQTKTALDSAWQSITNQEQSLSDLEIEQLRISLEGNVGDLGQTLDFMLDTLEGLEDTLPGEWIDNVETLEVEYSEWAVAARKIVFKHPNIPEVASSLQAQNETAAAQSNNKAPDSLTRDAIAVNTEHVPENTNFDFAIAEPTNPAREPSNWPLPTLSPVWERSESEVYELNAHQAHEQPHPVQPRFNFEPSDIREANQQDLSAHSRGLSVESVDSQIANPDGSYRFPVSRRQSIYRTASMATFGTIGSSQIKSVDLGRLAYGSSFFHPNEPKTTLARTRSAEELQANRYLAIPPTSEGVMSDEYIPESSSLEAIIQGLAEKIAPSSPVIETQDTSRSGSGQDVQNDLHYDESHVDDLETALDAPALAPAGSLFEPPANKDPHGIDVPDQDPDPATDWQDAPLTPGRPPRSSRLSISTDEQLERRIDRILTTIPERINFSRRTRPEQARNQTIPSSDKANGSGFRNMTPTSDRSATPSLTLAPAEQKEPRAAKSSGDSAIKLYYLYQAGRQHPIKLYVRLVGENGERVMVRVGGGWADLGEYLRDYASHHSRTVIPDLNEPLQAVDLSQPLNSRVFSLPVLKNSSSPTPPDSPIDERRWSGPKNQKISNTPGDNLQVPLKRPSLREKSLKQAKSLQHLSSQDRDRDENNRENKYAAAPRDAHASGPGKISAEKKEWLEKMVSKAKKWKAEGGASKRSQGGATTLALGDMGNAGATRRVYRLGD